MKTRNILILLGLFLLKGCISAPEVNKVEQPYSSLQVMFSTSLPTKFPYCTWFPGFQKFYTQDKAISKCAEVSQEYNGYLFYNMAREFTAALKINNPAQSWYYTTPNMHSPPPGVRVFNPKEAILYIQIANIFTECKTHCMPLYDFKVFIQDKGEIVWSRTYYRLKPYNYTYTGKPDFGFLQANAVALADRVLASLQHDEIIK